MPHMPHSRSLTQISNYVEFPSHHSHQQHLHEEQQSIPHSHSDSMCLQLPTLDYQLSTSDDGTSAGAMHTGATGYYDLIDAAMQSVQ